MGKPMASRRARPALSQCRLAPLPAVQGEIDELLFGRRDGTPVGLVAVGLPYSRALFAELRIDLGDEALCAALERAWAFFGGAPRRWWFDSLRRPSPPLVALTRRFGALLESPSPFSVRGSEWPLWSLPMAWITRQGLFDLRAVNLRLRRVAEERLWRDHPTQRHRRVVEVLAEERPHLQPGGEP